jgi:hypothetical protein
MKRCRTRIAEIFVLMLLVSSVACGELPELVSLTDNTSNDIVILSVPSAGVIPAAVTLVTPGSCAAIVSNDQKLSGVQQKILPSRSSRDVLALQSLLRT